MPQYMLQVSYSREGWQALIAQPQNRVEVVNAWFAFGDHDVILITEMPDNVSAAGLAIAFAGGGALKSVQTTPLLSADEALAAMKKAGESGYRPARAA
jgi:uncharacterized protein with GYD domain